ncbi:unnamed protein product [Pieris macdunnoughi]|uniref:Uncharacterized protein n=1 Tax=Pieris macdunnoughi TaxID=345717 RepID=A0A821QZ88_9NEOP|nr:unnamed protein product [Pieris macdunnoughi]
MQKKHGRIPAFTGFKTWRRLLTVSGTTASCCSSSNLLTSRRAFLTVRTFFIATGEVESRPRPIALDFPQGNVLSPLAYATYTGDASYLQSSRESQAGET